MNLFPYLCTAYAKTFMTKMIELNSKLTNLINLADLFRIEALAYTKVLPELGPFGPRCVHADPNTIIMEDLAEKGYVNCERRNLLDLDHTVFALKVRFLANNSILKHALCIHAYLI